MFLGCWTRRCAAMLEASLSHNIRQAVTDRGCVHAHEEKLHGCLIAYVGLAVLAAVSLANMTDK